MSQAIWSTIVKEAIKVASEEPALGSLIHETIINQPDFAHALSFHLSGKFQDQTISAVAYNHMFNDIMNESPCVVEAAIADLKAIKQRDPATKCYVIPMLYFKGFLALQVSFPSGHSPFCFAKAIRFFNAAMYVSLFIFL